MVRKKVIPCSIFSFSHLVLKKFLFQVVQNVGVYGKGVVLESTLYKLLTVFEKTKLKICPPCYKNVKENIHVYVMVKSTNVFVASFSFTALFFVFCVCAVFFFSYMNASNCEMFIQEQSMVISLELVITRYPEDFVRESV